MFVRSTIKGEPLILGTGIDMVKISRFIPWLDYSAHRLSKTFTQGELIGFLAVSTNMTDQSSDAKQVGESEEKNTVKIDSLVVHQKATYLASRFAAKEAFFKALSMVLVSRKLTKHEFGLTFACQNCEVVKGTWGVPLLKVRWSAFEKKIGRKLPRMQVHLSISHEHEYAIAQVLVSL